MPHTRTDVLLELLAEELRLSNVEKYVDEIRKDDKVAADVKKYWNRHHSQLSDRRHRGFRSSPARINVVERGAAPKDQFRLRIP
jgi:hypothetical protein